MFFSCFLYFLFFAAFFAEEVDKPAILDLHNELRNGAKPAPSDMKQLQWNDDLAKAAQEVADSCYYEHHNPEDLNQKKAPDGNPFGEVGVGQNLAVGTSSYTMSGAIKHWDSEKKDYDFCQNRPTRYNAVVGHYTQVVWADTTHVGCGKKRCQKITTKNGEMFNGDSGDMIACNYWPPGNYEGYWPYKTNPDVCYNGGDGGDSGDGRGGARALGAEVTPSTAAGIGVSVLASISAMLI